MHNYISRRLESIIYQDLKNFPIVAILGPRQCGKSTTAQEIIKTYKNKIYLDMELPGDLLKIEEPELFFSEFGDNLICLDEIQRKPGLFKVLRSIVDKSGKSGQILILGSSSPELLKQSSESLAGRIAYEILTPFTIDEIEGENIALSNLWLKGGYPRSLFLDNSYSIKWRENFIRTFLERDIPQLGFNIPAVNLHRFLTMCSHMSGQVLNQSKLGESLGLSHNTIKHYLDIYEQTFIIRRLHPYFSNIKKRIIKSPKIYIRDTGILHQLLRIDTLSDLFGHPIAGSSWESFCVENILSITEPLRWQGFYFRDSNRTEIDLILLKGQNKIALEFKMAAAPKLSKSFYNILKELNIKETWIIIPKEAKYKIKENIVVSGLKEFIHYCLNEL